MRAFRPLLVLLIWSGTAPGMSAEPLTQELKLLLGGHCFDCHGADTQQAGLRLDTVSGDLSDAAVARTWEKVLDKLSAGEMPPQSQERPPEALLRSTTELLRNQLHDASLARQQNEGRVLVRRLNNVEYENTLHDLLGIKVPLKELLPEDSTTAGFDNVSTGLDLSATHFLRYQEAAARAVSAVVPLHPPIPFSDTRTGLDMTKKGPNFREGLGRNSKLDGETLIFYSKLPRYGLCATAPVPTAGRYRIQMKACAVGAEARPIPVGLMTVMQSGREGPVLREVRDIPHGEPQVFEFECDLVSRQAFVVNLLTIWDIRRFKKPIEEYTGPGLLVEWMKIEGPLDAFPPPRYATLFEGVPLKARSVVKAEAAGGRIPVIRDNRTVQQWEADPLVPASDKPKEDAERLIRSFLPRAFRRPVSEEEQQHFVKATLTKLDQGHNFYDAMQYGYQLILSSPDFLFLLSSSSTSQLDDYALASRLSYFLWSTAPDAELLALADQGKLRQPAVLRAQVERMLSSPLAERFTKNFTGQWLDLRRIDFTIPDPVLYSDFDPLLLWSMPRETELFFEEVLRHDLSLLSFVDSDWSMLNERLGTLYGVPGLVGSGFHKTILPPESRRGGVMTQASVLKVTADGTRTSPVLRGAWVLDRILGKPPSPPPPDIPAIEPDIRGATTIRQQLDKHRNTQACATCHNHIDPPGFALENFDPVGNWRDFYRVTTRTPAGLVNLPYGSGRPVYRGPDVEQGGQTPNGRVFQDVTEYKRLLLEDKDQIARSLVRKMIIYATGAEIQFADREVVEQIVDKLRDNNYGLRTLVHEVVQSRVFLMK
ncbi:MAG TPA: DUF1592 domain-containing protein [Pirellulaceae bacterium]|nr:DUF1592 domain-containing protein [Pirellulaceae bacterium]